MPPPSRSNAASKRTHKTWETHGKRSTKKKTYCAGTTMFVAVSSIIMPKLMESGNHVRRTQTTARQASKGLPKDVCLLPIPALQYFCGKIHLIALAIETGATKC